MGNIPKLRFKEFSGEWDNKRIGQIGTFFSGGTPTSSNKAYYNGSIPFIGSGKIGDKEVKQYITQEALNNSSAKMVEKGDLLYALYGATSGAVALSKINGAINQAVLCIRTNENKAFLMTWLQKNKCKIIETYLQGGQGNLSASIVKSLKLNIPSLIEQEKIASFLTSIDRRIEQLTKKESLLRKYKKGVIQKIFNQEIRFKNDNGNEFPDWKKTELNNLLTERVLYPKNTLPVYSLTIENGVVPKSARYERAFLVKDDYEYKAMKKNDFAFNPMNLRFGALARHKEDIEVMVSKYYNIFYCDESQLNPKFAEEYFTNHNSIQYYNKMATGSLEEKKRVHFKEFMKFKFYFPCIEEQIKIANFLKSIGEKIDLTKKELYSIKEFKKALLQKMLI